MHPMISAYLADERSRTLASQAALRRRVARARQAGAGSRRGPGPVRRAVGAGLVEFGLWLSVGRR